MDDLIQHVQNQPVFSILLLCSFLIVIFSIPHFYKNRMRYGSYFNFVSKPRKILVGSSALVAVGLILYGFTPYVAPPTDEIAIILGNTQNTPAPKIDNDLSEVIENTMLQHRGDDVYELADSIKIISAVKEPVVINLDASELHLKEIGNNKSNAKRSAELNVKIIEKEIANLYPTDNGANYLEAILKARDNVEEGSRIIVIGSGLSDSGDLNFSESNILTNEESRNDIVKKIQDKYGSNYLDGYVVEFHGLGDTVAPQEILSTKQREIVRNLYKSTIRNLGGTTSVDTETLTGAAIATDYVVGTTDTGCGDIGLVFDDSNLKFVGNQATFTDEAAAKTSLTSIKTLWDTNSDVIESIQIDGYIAHHGSTDTLSQPRADLIKQVLVGFGIPQEKIQATGRGFGPYKSDAQNRIVKVTVSRDSEVCEN